MKAGHKPMRMCISCRKRLYKHELMRYVSHSGTIMSDPAQNMPGRGFYVCSDAECTAKMHRRMARL